MLDIWKFIYDCGLRAADRALVWLACHAGRWLGKGKFGLFVKGRRQLLERIQTEMPADALCPVYWFHAASLGEFGVAFPLIRHLREQEPCRIVLTFFSSTGYEVVRKTHPGIDHVFYLPLDTAGNAARFLDIVRPKKVFFIIAEYWVNYLTELKKRNIPTYLISALIGRHAPFFRWYGGLYRPLLSAYTRFLVLDEESVDNLHRLGYYNVTLTGDPLYDKALYVADQAFSNAVVERFAQWGDLFVAGSLSDRHDLNLICSLANRHRGLHFLIIPHEISEEGLNHIRYNLRGNALLYSECDEHTDFSSVQTLIIDYMGELAYLYRYGRWAYVGGGFTPYLHNVIEASVYGLPVAFGPCIRRTTAPARLMKLGVGQMVRSARELDEWFTAIRFDTDRLEQIRQTAADYARRQSGAAERVLQIVAS